MCVIVENNQNIFSKFNLRCVFFKKEEKEILCVVTYKSGTVERLNLKKDKIKRDFKLALLKLYKFSRI